MALITCPKCKKKVSDTAAACPNCGFKFTPWKSVMWEKIANIKKQQAQKVAGIRCLSVIAIFVVLYLIGSLSSGGGGYGQSAAPKAPGKIEAWVMAKQFVKDGLKSPGSADFGYQNPDEVVTDLGGGKFKVQAWVDAQNSFGAKIRNHFVCELEYAGNERWRMTNLVFA